MRCWLGLWEHSRNVAGIDSLDELASRYPFLEVQLASGAQGDVARKLLEHRADLGLLFHHEQMPDALERQRLGTIEMVTVCSPQHPLAELDSSDDGTGPNIGPPPQWNITERSLDAESCS
mgnify:CR=1 FL=1